MIVHANLVAKRIKGIWRGALIEGPSGAGKSDLTLRAAASGFRLVADDRTLLWVSGGRLFGRAPDALRDLIEVRGLGVMGERALAFSRVGLVVQCGRQEVERTPENATVTRMGLELPWVTLAALESSAPTKLNRALEHLGGGE